MILCRLYIGEFTETGWAAPFDTQGGFHKVVWVIDELAIKSTNAYERSAQVQTDGGKAQTANSYRPQQNYSLLNYVDKVVKPVHIKEAFGFGVNMKTLGGMTNRADLEKFADEWLVAVDVPPTARSIPLPAWGTLVPRVYDETGGPPGFTPWFTR